MWLGKYVIRYIYLKFNNLRKGDDVIHIFFNHLKDMVTSGYEEGDDCLTILPVGDVVVGDVRVRALQQKRLIDNDHRPQQLLINFDSK